MGSPVPGTQPSGNPGGTTFDEMESQLKAAETEALKQDLTKVPLEGDDIPADLKGKSAAEAIARVKELERVLQASEQGRQQALIMAQTASTARQPAPAEPVVVVEEQITAQMVAEAMQEDQLKGIQLMEKMQNQAIQRAADEFGKRIQPLISGTASSVEDQARRKYPDEFEIYADEIKAEIERLPNKNVMSTPNAWDDMIAYVRGKQPLKLYDRLDQKKRAAQQADAQATERQSVGFQATGSRPVAPTGGGVVVDDLTREVCGVLGISEDEYVKWSKV